MVCAHALWLLQRLHLHWVARRVLLGAILRLAELLHLVRLLRRLHVAIAGGVDVDVVHIYALRLHQLLLRLQVGVVLRSDHIDLLLLLTLEVLLLIRLLNY
jgi:hypothetical protein